uniref:RRP15-like protein n=1 Tax=Parascaris univalens TaxID=6257 RepID=A0A915A3T0_PARUN
MHSAKKLERTEAVLRAAFGSVPAESARDLADAQLTSYKQHSADEYMEWVGSVKSTAQPLNGDSSTNFVRKFFSADNMVTSTPMPKSKSQHISRPIRRGLPKSQRRIKNTAVRKQSKRAKKVSTKHETKQKKERDVFDLSSGTD